MDSGLDQKLRLSSDLLNLCVSLGSCPEQLQPQQSSLIQQLLERYAPEMSYKTTPRPDQKPDLTD